MSNLELNQTINSEDIDSAFAELIEKSAASKLTDKESQLHLQLLKVKNIADEYISDWKYGVTLIREDYFPEWNEELVKDCGYLPSDLPWWIVVDWEATADNVKVDYHEVEIGGYTYYVR